MKFCVSCKNEYPVSFYNRNKTKPDGLQNVCRECNRARSRKYYSFNKEKHRKVVAARSKRLLSTQAA